MSNRVIKRSAVKRDLHAHFVYIGADSEEAAFRFLSAAEESFRDLARNPLMGAACQLRGQHARSFRRWRVKGFENYWIFYRLISGGIEIARVMHGARNLERLLE
jgi:toxin ParE1/3/4